MGAMSRWLGGLPADTVRPGIGRFAGWVIVVPFPGVKVLMKRWALAAYYGMSARGFDVSRHGVRVSW